MKKLTPLIDDRFEMSWVSATAIGKVSTTNINETTINIVVSFVDDFLMA